MLMSDDADRIRGLEEENARLRHLLQQGGMPSALRHQVRNALGMMRAILRRSADNKSSVEDLTAHLEGRFDALLRVQTALLSSPDGRLDCAALVADELLAAALLDAPGVTLEGLSVRIDAHRAELLGLALHELATNAVKFGAASVPGGRLAVSWSVSPSGLLTLSWVETGLPPRSGDEVVRRGFGMEVLEVMLPYQLKADSRVEMLTGQLRCTIVMAVS